MWCINKFTFYFSLVDKSWLLIDSWRTFVAKIQKALHVKDLFFKAWSHRSKSSHVLNLGFKYVNSVNWVLRMVSFQTVQFNLDVLLFFSLTLYLPLNYVMIHVCSCLGREKKCKQSSSNLHIYIFLQTHKKGIYNFLNKTRFYLCATSTLEQVEIFHILYTCIKIKKTVMVTWCNELLSSWETVKSWVVKQQATF